jgi:hypothetical protein
VKAVDLEDEEDNIAKVILEKYKSAATLQTISSIQVKTIALKDLG